MLSNGLISLYLITFLPAVLCFPTQSTLLKPPPSLHARGPICVDHPLWQGPIPLSSTDCSSARASLLSNLLQKYNLDNEYSFWRGIGNPPPEQHIKLPFGRTIGKSHDLGVVSCIDLKVLTILVGTCSVFVDFLDNFSEVEVPEKRFTSYVSTFPATIKQLFDLTRPPWECVKDHESPGWLAAGMKVLHKTKAPLILAVGMAESIGVFFWPSESEIGRKHLAPSPNTGIAHTKS